MKPKIKTVRVWDLPIRVFHWALVFLVITEWATVKLDLMRWHKLSGYTIMALLLARLGWGVIGSNTARFSQFVRGPKAVLEYAKTIWQRTPGHHIGHNPMGALSVIALLLVLATQIGSGLILSDTDFVNSGPLSSLVGYDVSFAADKVHGISFTILEILVALHVAVIMFYWLYKGDGLVRPMITGRKIVPAEMALVPLRARPPWWALGLLGLSGLFVWWLVTRGAAFLSGLGW